MLDQKSDEPLVRSQWRAMNADRDLLAVIAVLISKIKAAWLREINLVRGDRKFAPDHAPCLHINFRTVKGCFIRHFDIVNSGVLQNAARHFFGFFPKLWFINKFLAKL